MTEVNSEVAELLREARCSVETTNDDKYYVTYRQFALLVEAGGRIIRKAKEGSYLDINDDKGPLRFVHRCFDCPHDAPTTYYM